MFLFGKSNTTLVAVLALCVLLGGAKQVSAGLILMSTDGRSQDNNIVASGLGYSVTTDSLANIVATPVSSLSAFDVVWINPLGFLDSSIYDVIRTGVANGGALEQYVVGGGTLVINIVGNAGNQSDIAPGGVDYDRSTTHNLETFTSPSHAYLTGLGFGGYSLQVANFYDWGETDGGTLQNIVAGTTTVLSNADGPSFVEYRWGNGTVILDTLTYGWGFNYDNDSWKTQHNLIDYASYVPEPCTLLLLGLGAVVLRRRTR